MKNRVLLKRFDTDLPLPAQQTPGSAGMDMYARVDVEVSARSIGYIPLNVALKVPEHHWVLLAARSSLHKYGLLPANGIGVGDEDFCGDEDEYQLIVYNYTDQDVRIERGMRVAQMIVMARTQFEVEEVDRLEGKSRGGIGSTGS